MISVRKPSFLTLIERGCTMSVMKEHNKHSSVERRRLRISSKRQLTIPVRYYDALGLSDEVDCIYSNGMLILLPVEERDSAFAEEILEELVGKGYTGERLLAEFGRLNRQVRPAIEAMIAEADRVAEEASAAYVDRTGEIFAQSRNKRKET